MSAFFRKQHFDVVKVSGADALRFLNGMWTADLKRATSVPESIGFCRSFLLTPKGKVVSESFIIAESTESFHILNPKGFGSKVLEAMDKYLVADQVTLEFLESSTWNEALEISESPAQTKDFVTLPVAVPSAKDKVFEVIVDGHDHILPLERLSKTHHLLFSKNAENKALRFGAKPCDAQAWKKLRINAGVPEFGVDLVVDQLPMESPHLDAISFHKGCYLGQEVVARGTYRGQMVKGLVRVQAQQELSEDFLYIENTEGDHAEAVVGRVSSAVDNLGLAQLRLSLAANPNFIFQKTTSGRRYLEKVDLLVESAG